MLSYITHPTTGAPLPSTPAGLLAAYPNIDPNALSAWDNGDAGVIVGHVIMKSKGMETAYVTMYADRHEMLHADGYETVREKHRTDPDYANLWQEGVLVALMRHVRDQKNLDNLSAWTLHNCMVANPDVSLFVLEGTVSVCDNESYDVHTEMLMLTPRSTRAQ